jgi:hypothetical protein
MCPMSWIRYSTTTGRSLDMEMLTEGDRGVAFENEFRYRNAKVRVTGSFKSMTVCSSGLSTAVFDLHGKHQESDR